jgi:predicted lipid-binding transport protein (Tim44 family)
MHDQDQEMKMKSFWLAIIAMFAAMTIGMADAEARRMGGGGSFGKQAPVQRQATPPQSPAGAQQAAPQQGAAAARQPGAAAAPAAAAGSRWMAPLAGIAAGLGLAALASWLGFGEQLATFMLLALLAVVTLVVVRMIMARRAGAQPQPAFAGGRSEFRGNAQPPAQPWRQPASAPSSASVAPVLADTRPLDTTNPAMTIPPGFDVTGFLHHAKVYFVRMQAAFDAGNTDDLREFTSPEMFAELKLQIDQRGGETGQTDVITLDAELLGVQQDARELLASVRFSGLLREKVIPDANPFEEVWNFAKPTDGKSGWVLAGIQQLSSPR